eukprot:GHVL01007007.1.p1 GENE.GHVL01007007.1~~GHVL01007007.1.p1  ORF type:complete len:863 (+),score=209.46 GHVL01007007.1:2-2590(+)
MSGQGMMGGGGMSGQGMMDGGMSGKGMMGGGGMSGQGMMGGGGMSEQGMMNPGMSGHPSMPDLLEGMGSGQNYGQDLISIGRNSYSIYDISDPARNNDPGRGMLSGIGTDLLCLPPGISSECCISPLIQNMKRFEDVNWTNQEQRSYSNYWRLANPKGLEFLDTQSAAEFLEKSRLDPSILHQIWSCVAGPSGMDMLSFWTALRLVAFAQLDVPINPQLIYKVPQRLPCFPDFIRKRNPSEVSDGSIRSMPPGVGETINPKLLGETIDPNLGYLPGDHDSVPDTPRENLPDLFTSVGSAIGGGVIDDISDTERSKYWNAFLERETSHGFITGPTTRAILQKSRLPNETLRKIWQLVAMGSENPNLTGRQFVAAMHLTTKCKKGATLPQYLPNQLETYIKTGELQKNKVQSNDVAESFSHQLIPVSPDTPSRERKKDESPPLTEESFHRRSFDSGSRNRASSRNRELLNEGRSSSLSREVGATTIESMIESDKRLTRTLKNDIDYHADDLRRMDQSSDTLQRELVHERAELERQLERKRDFERQVYNMRLELDKMKEERRKVDIERISTSRDMNHYQEEIIFMRQQIEDINADISLMHESNKMLETNYKGAEIRVGHLERSRREILTSVKAEKDLLAKEEREIAQMKNQLDRLRREKTDSQALHQVLHEKFRQQTWMQGRPVNNTSGQQYIPDSFKSSRSDDEPQKNIWSSSVMSGAPPARDKKGVPAGSITLTDIDNAASRASDVTTSPGSSRNQWAAFGSSKGSSNLGGGGSGVGGSRRGVEALLAGPLTTPRSDVFDVPHPLTDRYLKNSTPYYGEEDVKGFDDVDNYRKYEQRRETSSAQWPSKSGTHTPAFGGSFVGS